MSRAAGGTRCVIMTPTSWRKLTWRQQTLVRVPDAFNINNANIIILMYNWISATKKLKYNQSHLHFGPKIVCQKNSGCKSCRQPSASTFAALLKLLLIKLSQVIHLPVPRSISKYSINVLFSLVPHFPKLSAPVGLSVSLTHIWCSLLWIILFQRTISHPRPA